MEYSGDLIEIEDLKFEKFKSSAEISKTIERIVDRLHSQFDEGERVTFICILKGSFVFTADLVRAFNRPCTIEFIRCRSYQGLTSNRSPQIDYTSFDSLEDQHVVILEDIVETGHSLDLIHDLIMSTKPASLTTVCLLHKPDSTELEIPVDHVGFKIDNAFVIGYGLDYNGQGRNLPDIYRQIEESN
ncbi:MAG: hypoxanthine phosphoribosyltransferase [Saprospiraceae bacterium]|nr:hypoxanthine phosphoribosyltransferase [Saprospiraceae bacterium]